MARHCTGSCKYVSFLTEGNLSIKFVKVSYAEIIDAFRKANSALQAYPPPSKKPVGPLLNQPTVFWQWWWAGGCSREQQWRYGCVAASPAIIGWCRTRFLTRTMATRAGSAIRIVPAQRMASVSSELQQWLDVVKEARDSAREAPSVTARYFVITSVMPSP